MFSILTARQILAIAEDRLRLAMGTLNQFGTYGNLPSKVEQAIADVDIAVDHYIDAALVVIKGED